MLNTTQNTQNTLMAAIFIFLFIFSGCNNASTLYAHPLPTSYTIDRIEGEYMVLINDKEEKIIPVQSGAKEGYQLTITPSKTVIKENVKLKSDIIKLQQSLTTKMVAMNL